MAMWTIVIKNSSGSDVTVEDLGVDIINAGQETLSDEYTFDQLSGSDDLRALVAAGTLVVNDGTGDLASAVGVSRLTIYHEQQITTNYFSKAELAASGGAPVNWNNITNAPSFGAPDWVSPVKFRVRGTELAVAPITPISGDVYVDSIDHYQRYNGTIWVDLGLAVDGDEVIDLTDATEVILSFNTGTWTAGTAPTDNLGIMVDDDGDGNPAQYVYQLGGTAWLKIADVDFAGHFDGGASKHDASEIDVEGVYPNIPGSPTDLESIVSAVDTEIGTLQTNVGNVTLDSAYDKGGAGLGRTIVADSGAVILDASGQTTAPIEIAPQASAPSSGLADGQICYVNGILYAYDATRAKWLSVQKYLLVYGRQGNTRNQFLAYSAGSLSSNNSGLRMMRNACIVGMSSQIDQPGTCTMKLRKNDTPGPIATISIAAGLGAHDITLNVDMVAGDFLQARNQASTAVNDPMLMVELAWRL